ncbi:hypothetical protein ACHQM5_004167 [Ranunculus cassubicifolius]
MKIMNEFVLLLLCFVISRSQVHAQPRLDPIELTALNSIFRQWGISADRSLWNTTGEPCTGVATNSTPFGDIPNYNPGIKCVCTDNNGTTCHVTQLRVYAINVVGTIPDELANLTFLTFLNLDQNYLTGPLPAFIGNLSRLETLSVGINALSGPIPEELGRLRNLQTLAFGSNRFSGTLPPQLGSLVNLEQIYMDSSGVGGEIPTTFENLVNMRVMWASDNPFTGTIPDFIGNWTQLTSLRFYGNSFEGPIPSSFSRLTSLTDLRVSDLSNVSSSLTFVRDMRNLTVLVLRNNLLSGSVPSSIAENRLLRLDLSFNNLTGQPPATIFNLSSLSYLFLGNNSLSGSLPPQISPSLLAIDLSYNRFSGSLPSWANQRTLQLNVISNNLTFDSSNNSFLASGLNCLLGQFPCGRGNPSYSSFAINCGGPQRSSTEGIIYEAENSTANPASYNVRNDRKWAVSNVGLFGDSSGPSYVVNKLVQTTGTLDTELFQTARLSPGSLRYFGLGLENGPYNVNLQFAETGFDDESTRTWKSLGRRVFDIYLQGALRVKDFDIRREAGGAIDRAVLRDFKVQVSENFLEIHLFWAGKGTCCIPRQGYYGPLISAIKVTADFEPTVDNLPPSPTTSSKDNTGTIVGITIPLVLVTIIAAFVIFYLRRKKSSTNDEEELLGMENRPNTFSYAELKSATGDFSPTNKLGEGGFGPVYQGMLNDGRAIAVKTLLVTSRQGKSQFAAEISIISAVQHRNLVKLYGCCIEGENRMLVYEHLKNKSLDQALFGPSALDLDWQTRYNICLGTARGLAYLHEESTPRIVHRDVKASNILLDFDLNPKISDFGLAKLYDDKKTHISTRVAGTIGYLAPEYAMRGHLTEKADVFGFGVVALELLCGRANTDQSLDPDKIYLLEWAWTLYESNRGLELVDPRLIDFNKDEAIRMLGISLLCTQAQAMMRPPMSRVVAMLAGDIDVSTVTQKPSYLTDWQVSDMSSFVSDDGGDSRYRSSSSMGQGTGPLSSGVTQSMMYEVIGEGR